MQLSNITRKILKTIAGMHHAALTADCKYADLCASRAFSRVEQQAELIKAAKEHMHTLQTEAGIAHLKAHKMARAAANEIDAIKAASYARG